MPKPVWMRKRCCPPVETRKDTVEELAIRVLIASENGIGAEIGKLQHARMLPPGKVGNIYNIAEVAISCASLLEFRN